MDYLLVALLGLMAGGVVNLLADDLPAGRKPGLPKYPDGRRRPMAAWLGTSAFVFNLRRAPTVTNNSTMTDDVGRPALSWRYPLVELALSALMALVYSMAQGQPSLPGEKALIWGLSVALFVLIAVVDIEHRRILLAPLLAIVAFAIINGLAFPKSPPSVASMMIGAICAGMVYSLAYLGGRLFAYLAERRWHSLSDTVVFGLGDVYLRTVGGLNRRLSQRARCIDLDDFSGRTGLPGALGYLVTKTCSEAGTSRSAPCPMDGSYSRLSPSLCFFRARRSA